VIRAEMPSTLRIPQLAVALTALQIRGFVAAPFRTASMRCGRAILRQQAQRLLFLQFAIAVREVEFLEHARHQ